MAQGAKRRAIVRLRLCRQNNRVVAFLL